MLRVNALTGFGGGRRVTSLTFVDSATSAADTITIPATAQAGDVAVLVDYAHNTFSSIPTDVVPTGWTGWDGSLQGSDTGDNEQRGRMSYKVLVSGDPNTAITGMDAADDQKVLLVFRGNAAVTTITASTADSQLTTGDPASDTVSASGQIAPLVVIGAIGSDTGTTAFSTASPAFDGTVTTAAADLIMGYKIYNSAPADHTIDSAAIGNVTYLTSGYLRVS